ncbi:MAG: VOC family protein [Dehalococcoidia bacterium]|nr:MAG: VOC family protein [Dehalococcoidia bacterium]
MPEVSPRLIPELLVSDIAASVRFYVDVLGFTILYERPEECFAHLDREGARIMLEQPVGRTFLVGPLQHPYGLGMNLQIQATAIDALYASVQAAGALIVLPMEEKWYRRDETQLGNRQFVVQDPDGYLLRFFENLGTRPA